MKCGRRPRCLTVTIAPTHPIAAPQNANTALSPCSDQKVLANGVISFAVCEDHQPLAGCHEWDSLPRSSGHAQNMVVLWGRLAELKFVWQIVP